MKKGLRRPPQKRTIGPVQGTVPAFSFSCSARRQERRLRNERSVCVQPDRRHHSRRAFRKTHCSSKQAYPPQNRRLPANSRTTHLGPFGELIRATGPMAKLNPFRFSTKYQDDESDLVYYGYRYYNPSTGRWLSRDPQGERGGLNLYDFVRNSPLTRYDILGRSCSGCGNSASSSPSYCSSVDMFFSYWLGQMQNGGLSPTMMLDVENDSTVQGFGNGAVASQPKLQCGKSGTYGVPPLFLSNFNPGNGFGITDVSYWDWVLTGNWQLSLSATCSWKCNQCGPGQTTCPCSVQCKVKGTISKLYTFLYLGSGSNPANICTTGLLSMIDGANIISQSFSLNFAGVSNAKCCQ